MWRQNVDVGWVILDELLKPVFPIFGYDLDTAFGEPHQPRR